MISDISVRFLICDIMFLLLSAWLSPKRPCNMHLRMLWALSREKTAIPLTKAPTSTVEIFKCETAVVFPSSTHVNSKCTYTMGTLTLEGGAVKLVVGKFLC